MDAGNEFPVESPERLSRPTTPRMLSKSRYLAGTQCLKRLWLECHAPELAGPFDAATAARLAEGHAVGRLARELWPGGTLVEESHTEHERACEVTARLLADPTVPAIYEAAFTADDVRIRADVLVRAGDDGWDLVEVKSTSSLKSQHVPDVTVQLHCLEAAGLRIRRAGLLHLNPSYVYPGGDYDPEALFVLADLTEGARADLAALEGSLASMKEVIRLSAPPRIDVGPHCERPYSCPFLDHCTADEPEFPVRRLYRARGSLLDSLRTAGIGDVREIPDDFPGLSEVQARIRDATRSGERFVDPAVREALAGLEWPLHFLDFETISTALPRYAGTRPWQTVPFQWSLHVLESSAATPRHTGFLPPDGNDPRPAFVDSLAAAAGERGAILVWSGYEDNCLRQLADDLPSRRREIDAIRSRLFDLLVPVRGHVYDPAFEGSFSLKSVLPALVPELGYDDLGITDGGAATVAWLEALEPDTPAERRGAIRRDLEAYCGRDTEALVALWRALVVS